MSTLRQINDSTAKIQFGVERLMNIGCLNILFLYLQVILIYVLQYL